MRAKERETNSVVNQRLAQADSATRTGRGRGEHRAAEWGPRPLGQDAEIWKSGRTHVGGRRE